jgi:hypothetical protein
MNNMVSAKQLGLWVILIFVTQPKKILETSGDEIPV